MSTATMNGTAGAPSPFAGHASKGGNYETCPAGNHPAYLVAIYDLGTHDTEFQGETKPDTRLWYLAWEVSGEMKADGSSHIIGKDYTVFVDKDGGFSFPGRSALRLMLEAWRGSKFGPGDSMDPGAALGKPCALNVTHSTNKEKTYANIDGVKPLIKGTPVPKRHHDLVAYLVSMGPPPVIPWLPKIWWRDSGNMEVLEDVVSYSKEMTGKPIGDGRAKDTPYSEAVKPEQAALRGEILAEEDIPF